ncbi:Hypothetical protein R9X50_00622500 [Acrodontium crateriforme]|uniref:Long-chain-alcohol oxidase n=1 Tax=Acrodontium crateriforme TaxID=150365 RepID=A0AAQ3MD41_9PEZI|nr:Hypothetical protein R9X50_00622500 [Acrodontium crateriforme]
MTATADNDAGLSPEQWGILAAIAGAFVPSCTSLNGNRLLQNPLPPQVYDSLCQRIQQNVGQNDDQELVAKFMAESATSQPAFQAAITDLVKLYMPDEAKKGLFFILKALNTRAGSLVLTGYATSLDCLPVADRQQILQSWATSRLPFFRNLHKSLSALVRSFWLRTSANLRAVIDCPERPVHNPPPKAFHPFEFIQFASTSLSEPDVIEADVVIVGSGCGGAVAAKTLAEAGLNVIVVDKSYYWTPQMLPLTEASGLASLFENGGTILSDDASMTVVAGSAWGGGGTVNWSASLQTQSFVRREWSQKFGLPYFTTSAFQDDLDKVCERMGVGTSAIEHNKGNRALLEGARKLGFTVKPVPQNTGGEAHNCGYCTLGCGSCGKKGPTESWLPDAAKAGARFIEGFNVSEVTFADTKTGGNRIVTGVKGTWTSRDGNGKVAGSDRRIRQVIIKAPRVVASMGTLGSPLLLKRSGLTNSHIGRHLHLHPASIVGAVWDEDVRPWEGPILTSVCTEFENLDGEGYGAKLEATAMIPSLFLTAFPWRDGLHFKETASKMKRMTGYISLARDRYGGRVFPDPIDGRCRIRYTTNKYDQRHILEGIAGLSQMLYVEGAREIHTSIPGLDPFVRPSDEPNSKITVARKEQPSINDEEFKAWLAKMHHVGVGDTPFASAHQMGTCRMGSDASNSVIGPNGQVWGTKGLYVADASAFPSASGVNPMITTMAISRGIARGIAKDAGVNVGTAGLTKL